MSTMVVDDCIACGRWAALYEGGYCDSCRRRVGGSRRSTTIARHRRRTTCTCDTPSPVSVRLFGHLLIEGAQQCGHCGRAVLA